MIIHPNKLFGLVCIFMLVISSDIQSQDFKLAGFNYSTFPSAEIEETNSGQETELSEYNFFLNIPQPLKNDRTVMIYGLQYTLVNPTGTNSANSSFNGQNLHVIGYRLTVLHELTDQWSLLASANPIISSTLNTNLEEDDFIFNGLLQFVNNQSETSMYGFGVIRTARFGKPVFLPIVQLGLNSGAHNLSVVLPQRVAYDYQFGDLSAGLQLAVNGSQYNANYSTLDPFGGLEPIDRLAYTRVLLGPTLKYRVGAVLQLEAAAGLVTARSIEVKSEIVNDETFDIENGPFFQIGFSIVPPMK